MMVVCKFQKLMRQTLFELAIEGFRNKIQTNSSHLLGKQFFSFEKECLTKGDINTRNHILDIVYHIICELTTECDSVNNSQDMLSETQLQKSGVIIKGGQSKLE